MTDYIEWCVLLIVWGAFMLGGLLALGAAFRRADEREQAEATRERLQQAWRRN